MREAPHVCLAHAFVISYRLSHLRVLDVLGGGLGMLLAARTLELDSQWPQQTGLFLS